MIFLSTYFGKMSGGNALPPRPAICVAMVAGTGAFLAISATVWAGDAFGKLLIMAPLGASCFLAFALPESPLAQPRNIVFGHFISSLIGLICLHILGDSPVAMAFAVGMAVSAMMVTRTSHAPAGADPLVMFALQPDWEYLLTPVLAGSVTVALVALLFNNLRRKVRYPHYW